MPNAPPVPAHQGGRLLKSSEIFMMMICNDDNDGNDDNDDVNDFFVNTSKSNVENSNFNYAN